MLALPGAITLGHKLLHKRAMDGYKPKAQTETVVKLRIGPYAVDARNFVFPFALVGTTLIIIGVSGTIRAISIKDAARRP